jgi:hypothetical protein
VVDPVEAHAGAGELGGEVVVHPPEVALGEVAARDAGLVGDDDEAEAGLLEGAELPTDPVVEDEVLGARGIVARLHQRPVAVEEEGAILHRSSIPVPARG